MIKTLIGIRLRSMLSSLSGKRKDGKPRGKGAIIGIAAVYAFLGLIFAFYSVGLSILIAPTAIAMEMDWLIFLLFNVVSFSVIFILSVFETKSFLYECKDNDLLLSMPIKPRDIIISRIAAVLVMNYLEAAIMILPAVVVYAIFGGSLGGIIGGILVSFIMLPLIATALSSFVGYLVALLSARLKKKSLISLGLYVGFMLLYFFGYSYFMNGMELIGEDPESLIGALSVKVAFLRGFGEASLILPLPFLLMLLATVVISSVALWLISKHYIRIVTASVGSSGVVYKEKRLSSSSSLVALSKKELRRFFSSSTYMLNGVSGMIFEIIVTVLVVLNFSSVREMIDTVASMFQFDGTGAAVSAVGGIILAFSAMNSISASALSLEGRSLWIIKTAPVRSIDVLLSKLVPHLALSIPTSVLTAVILAAAVGAGALDYILLVLVAVLANLLFAEVGIIINVAMPKFDYENEAQVVKQSGAATIVVLGGMLVGVILLAGSVALGYFLGALGALILLLAIILITVGMYFVLTGPTLRKYERL